MTKFNINSPSFTPSMVEKTLEGSPTPAAAAPAFVPKKTIDLDEIKSKLTISKEAKKENTVKLNPAVKGFTPKGPSSLAPAPTKIVDPGLSQPQEMQQQQQHPQSLGHDHGGGMSAGGPPGMPQIPQQMHYDDSSAYYDEMANNAVMAAAQNQSFPLQYHLYAPHYLSASRKRQLSAHQKTSRDFFLDPALHQRLQQQSESLLRVAPNSTLPRYVDKYHSLVLLDAQDAAQGDKSGLPQWVYKCMSTKDGKHYALRRIEGFVLTNEQAMGAVRRWQTIVHPAFVGVHEAFTTRDFGDASLCMVYDFYPGAETLFDLLKREKFARETIMSYLLQLLSVLDTIHAAGLAAKTVDPTKILVTGPGRVRLNCCGLYDVVHYDKDQDVALFQQQDLRNLGLLVLCLACNSVDATKNVEQSLGRLDEELREIVQYLVSSNQKTASRVLASLSHCLTTCLNSSLDVNDRLEHELRRELENGRLVRLMAKLNFITERPDSELSQQWSETGDRYLIKLFRDYVFHQQDEMGKAVMDLGHVVRTLNKLDAGVDERITLISRNGQNCLIVSFKELRQCIENALRELE